MVGCVHLSVMSLIIMKSVPPVTVASTYFMKAFHPISSQLTIVCLLKCNSYPLNHFFEDSF